MNVDYVAQPLTILDESAARSGMYRLLARLWLREIDRDFFRDLCTPPLRDSFIEAGGVIPTEDGRDTMEQLAVEYCQLFVGPAEHLPPVQSVWQTGQFQSATTTSVRIFMDIVGYPTDVLPSGVMLDHLGVQLDVMAHILAHVSNLQSEEELLSAVLKLANSFFTMHLAWPSQLLAGAVTRATTEFYRSTTLLTRDFLNSEVAAANGLAHGGDPFAIPRLPQSAITS